MGTIYIIEDDMIIAADISMQLTQLGYLVAGISIRAEDAIAGFENNRPDLILMDINLGGNINGIEASQQILEKFQIPVIFLTSNSDDKTFQDALKTKPYAFISKPFQKSDLERNLMIAMERIKVESTEVEIEEEENNALSIMDDRLFLRHKEMMVKVAIEDILFVEADRNYCKVITADQMYFLSLSLSKFEVHLTHKSFLRVHRSFVINIQKITAINAQHEYVEISKHHIPISRRLRPELIKKLKLI